MRPVEEKTFRTHDGVELFYRHWPAASGAARGAIVLFHRGHEHSGRMAHLVDELDLPDFDFFAWDARGHGRSPGARGDSARASARRCATCRRSSSTSRRTYGVRGRRTSPSSRRASARSLVAAWVHDYAPRIRCMVLASPAFKVKLYVPFARPGWGSCRRCAAISSSTSYVKARFLTHDPERIASYDADPLIARADLRQHPARRSTRRPIASSPTRRAITVPTQLLISGADWVVHHAAAASLLRAPRRADQGDATCCRASITTRSASGIARVAVGKARALHPRRASPSRPSRPSLLDADRTGFTRDEADALASPLPPLSPRGLYWAATRGRTALRRPACPTASASATHRLRFGQHARLRLSQRAAGRGAARPPDRPHLSRLDRLARHPPAQAPSSRSCCATAMATARAREACRCASSTSRPATAATCSRRSRAARSSAGVDPAARLQRPQRRGGPRADRGKGPRRASRASTRATRSTARASRRSRRGRRSASSPVSTSSFPTTRWCARSLAGLADAIPPGGYLVYTGQPWHPQLELIARALTSHRQGRRGSCAGARRPRWTSSSRRPASARSSSASTSGASSPCRSPSGVTAHRRRRVARRGAAVAARARLARFPRAVLLRDLRLRELGRGAARRRRRRSSSRGSARFRSSPGRSCRTGRSTSSTACRSSSARTRGELDTHGRRLLTAQLVAVACFFSFPLRFSFERPGDRRRLRRAVRRARRLRQPFNQAPSLHIALLVILWALYARQLPRWRRMACCTSGSC